MAALYLFAHFDDEFWALPLVTAGVAAGEEAWFLYVCDYRTPELARRRFAETRRLLAHLGVDPARAVHLAGRAQDGAVHRALPGVYAAVREAVARIGPVSRIVAPAWEGGHPDHDMCALMAATLATELATGPVEIVSLYNGPGLPGPLLHGASPLPENGPVTRIPLTFSGWLSWLAAVRFYPSQIKAGSGLWPATFFSFARRGFGVQRLDPARVRQRPHAGPLFYERMFKVPYAEVRAAADAFLAGRP